jgi:crotonobetainyl-CoA:carnitine CoA-transferase CaiB-like acyl-CoA transferase
MLGVMRGIRVVEVADYIFVPAAGGVLADWGADVIKVEHHERGDAARGQVLWLPPDSSVDADHAGLNPIVEAANRGKRSIGIDLASREGLEILYRLIDRSDVFLTNKLADVRKRLGIDVDQLRARNPSLIYVRGSGHGIRGPEASRGGFDLIDFWYRSGIAESTRPLGVDSVPGMPAGGFGDFSAAMNAVAGVSAALMHRERTGDALTVDVSLLGTALWSFGGGVATSMMAKAPMQQRKTAPTSLTNPLVGAYRCADGRFIAFCCLQPGRYWQELCTIFGLPDLIADDRFITAQNLLNNAPAAAEIVAEQIGLCTLNEWKFRLSGFSGQWSVIQNSLDVAEDVQVEANSMLREMRSSAGPDITVVSSPVSFDEDVASPGSVPAFNEHCESILAEIGFSETDILSLKLNGAVA